jgi:hypothetical protein
MWNCLYCHHPLPDDEQCPMPACVEARAAARRRMGVEERRPPEGKRHPITSVESQTYIDTGEWPDA